MLNKYFKLFAILFAFAFIVSCSDDDNGTNPSVSEAQILAEYIESTTDYVNTYAPAMISAVDVRAGANAGTMEIIDIRSADAFAAGHIDGAVHVPPTDVLDYINANGIQKTDEIAVVCYSGQTASFVTSLLRLAGYDNAKTLKFGMCSWSEETMGSWPSNISNAYAAQFVTDATAKGPKGDLPTLNTGYSTGEEILMARIEYVMKEGFGEAKITNAQVFGNLTGYYIVNYWKDAHYNNPGHIPGAMQYTPKESLALDTDLKTLPTDKTVVVYCYTGQTSAHVSAFLRVLGYDAKSLLFGCNGMIYDVMDNMEGFTVWHDTYCQGYDLVQ